MTRFLLAAVFAVPALAAPVPDADTRAWLATTATLASDAMEGRDTGRRGTTVRRR